ncbi:HAD family hydrolase [Fusobacterium polymorphum]|uniref:Haloacid dehalogenase n=1 Tax=Fusobacterium nucleatum subsp. polymorphum TaxID=76857 RepID=A0A2C6CLP7_FUSNP|nr:HAD-IA family hydrolase [Fusobacterium polymorphum]PHI16995.1 haloacid dehalogenase [Fusobacterium polymorphum]
MKKNKLILCDLDGTLFDTLEVNYYSYKESLNKFNCDIGYDFFLEECYGKYYKNFLSKLGFNEEEMEKIHKIKKELYRKYLGSAKINENLFDMLQIIKDFYHIALVTTASQKNSEEILNFFNKRDLFELIISAEDVKNKKPDPEGFVKAMNYFNIAPKDTIIFEDSNVGIEAAIKSGANILKVKKF